MKTPLGWDEMIRGYLAYGAAGKTEGYIPPYVRMLI